MKKLFLTLLMLAIIPSVFADVMITEVMFNPDGADEGHEWIEIHNYADTSVDITGWKFYENNGNHNIKLKQGTLILGPYDTAIIADNADKFLEDYSGYKGNVYDTSFGSLSNSGEYIAIKDSFGNTIDYAAYPTVNVPSGFSVEIIDPDSNSILPQGWKQGDKIGGSPGQTVFVQPESEDSSGSSGNTSVPEFTAVSGTLIILTSIGLMIRKRNLN